MNLLRASATIGGLSLISRVLGFVRDILAARYMGAGFAMDAFLVAFRLPNLFRALFAEGAFAAVFVPMFSRIVGRNGGDTDEARAFAGEALSVLLPVLVVFTALMMLAAGPVVWAMNGFDNADPEKARITAAFTRITFPYLMLISLASLFGGVLNSVGRFWVNAAAPVLLNLTLIAGLTVFRAHDQIEIARGQSIAVTIAGALQLAWVWSASVRAGQPLRIGAPRLTPRVRELLRVIGPAALGAGATQVNFLISTILAWRFLPQGAVSYLYYSDRLGQLPLGLVGIGVGTAITPMISRAIGKGDEGEAGRTQNRAIELVLLLTLPAAVALVVSALPLVTGLFQHGVFHARDSVRTAAALSMLSLGLPAYVLIKVLTPGFYARADTKTPVRIAMLAVGINFVGNVASVWSLGILGIALSTAVSGWANAGLLYLTLHRRGQLRADARLKRVALKLVIASALMAGVLALIGPRLLQYMTGVLAVRALALAALVGSGFAAYALAALVLGAVNWADLKRQLVRRPPPPLSAA